MQRQKQQDIMHAASEPANIGKPTRAFNYVELADIYNRARTDYLVPMPMNAKRMQQYVENYDIDLDASLVAIDPDDGEPNGVIMLGVRDDRSWITRLGVIPERRRRHTGQFLMRAMIDWSIEHHMRLMQLEVIKGNEPAYRLFRKLGFEVTRELLVIRRAPGKLPPEMVPPDNLHVETIMDDFEDYLVERGDDPSWLEETASLMNMTGLYGFDITLPDGENGWIIFQRSPFQLTHFVLKQGCSPELQQALIAQVHHRFPLQDTKLENVPANHPTWCSFQKYGYVEDFRRIEMFLHF